MMLFLPRTEVLCFAAGLHEGSPFPTASQTSAPHLDLLLTLLYICSCSCGTVKNSLYQGFGGTFSHIACWALGGLFLYCLLGFASFNP